MRMQRVLREVNALASGDKGTWTFGQFGQDRDLTRWIGEEDLFKAGAKYWSASEFGTWMQYSVMQYKMDLANVTQYDKIEQEISSDMNAYISNYRTRAILGQLDVDSTWDEYLSELNRMGYNRMIDELDKVEPLEDIIAAYQH